MPKSIYYDVVEEEQPPFEGYGLGRYIYHDSRSLDYAVPEQLPAKTWWGSLFKRTAKPKTRVWELLAPVLNQGSLGACTGFAATGLLGVGSAAYPEARNTGAVSDAYARHVYSEATKIDAFRGVWPPTDSGSSGLAVMKVLKQVGWVKGYKHALSLNGTINALQDTPVIVGMTWREDMYYPDFRGHAKWTGPAVGGHEVLLYGVALEYQKLYFRNSWGQEWGNLGTFTMSFDDFRAVLKDRADVTVPVW